MMDRDDRPTDSGMPGSEAEDPGPGRGSRRSDPDPAPTVGADGPEPTTSAMADADPGRTRLGRHERARARP
jgi:hypothetical protein